MGKAKVLLTLVFTSALAAGLIAGMLVPRLQGKKATGEARGTPLATELGLTDGQSRQMREIWEGVRGKVDDCFQRAQDVQRHRDEALLALLSKEQREQYARAQRKCDAELQSIKAERDADFREAVRRTEEMLTPPQRERYRQILESRVGPAAGAGTPDWIPASRPSSMPTR